MTQVRWTITVGSQLEVIGYNPENADLDCPNGEMIGERYFLLATNDHGDRRWFGTFETADEAAADVPTAPEVEFWPATHPEYGSQAWAAYGEDDQIASEARMEEAQAFGFDTRFSIF